MSKKKKVIIITGGVAGPITTENLPGKEEETTTSIEYNDEVVSDAEAEAALQSAVDKLT